MDISTQNSGPQSVLSHKGLHVYVAAIHTHACHKNIYITKIDVLLYTIYILHLCQSTLYNKLMHIQFKRYSVQNIYLNYCSFSVSYDSVRMVITIVLNDGRCSGSSLQQSWRRGARNCGRSLGTDGRCFFSVT